MTQPATPEHDTIPSVSGLAIWGVLLIALLLGLVLYFRYGSQVNPLLHLDSLR